MKKHPSPLKTIRLHCLWCCNGQSNEVRLCGAVNCKSYPLRFGKSVAELRPLTVIKDHCAECSGDEQAKDCMVTGCALFPFRTGKNPNRAGLGNHAPNQVGLTKNSRTHGAKTERTPCKSKSCLCEESCDNRICSDRGSE